MREDLKDRLLDVTKRVEKLHQLRHMVAQAEGTSPRGHVASACLAAAEFLAAVTGNAGDTGLVHRAYEEIFAAVEDSEAIDEMFRWDRVASYEAPEYHGRLTALLQNFRLGLLSEAERKNNR